MIVCETLTALGFDIRDPTAAQADMIYLRKMRIGSDMMTTKVRLVIAGTLVSTALYLLWAGFRAAFRGEP